MNNCPVCSQPIGPADWNCPTCGISLNPGSSAAGPGSGTSKDFSIVTIATIGVLAIVLLTGGVCLFAFRSISQGQRTLNARLTVPQ